MKENTLVDDKGWVVKICLSKCNRQKLSGNIKKICGLFEMKKTPLNRENRLFNIAEEEMSLNFMHLTIQDWHICKAKSVETQKWEIHRHSGRLKYTTINNLKNFDFLVQKIDYPFFSNACIICWNWPCIGSEKISSQNWKWYFLTAKQEYLKLTTKLNTKIYPIRYWNFHINYF